MSGEDLQEAIDRLYAAPLEAFVEERKRLAKALRSAGDRGAAAGVAKLPKPTAAAWALNHVARTAPGVTQEWLRTATELRRATADVGRTGGEALRAASTAHRATTAALMTAVRETARPGGRALSEPLLDRVRALLHLATADEALALRLRAGRLTDDRAAPGGLSVAAAPGIGPAPGPTSAASQPDAEAQARERRRAELEARAGDAARELERLREESRRRQAAATAAEQRLEEARRTLHRTTSEAEAARDAVADAERGIAAAERELEQLQVLLRRDED